MSKLQEIKEIWAKGQGFDSFEIMRQEKGIDELDLDIICKEYATICSQACLEKASISAKVTHEDMGEIQFYTINKASVTNTKNIVLL